MAARLDQGLRKDAQENRERLLAAASELFAEHGLGVTLNDIAHHAGVGVGTAYRRFKNKEEVIDALFEQRLQVIEEAAQRALAEPNAWDGLVMYLGDALHLRYGDRGLNEIMNNRALGDKRVAEVRDRIAPILVALIDNAKAQGVVRPDFDQSDLIFLQLGLSAIMEQTREVSPDLYRRYLAMMLDGIRADGQSRPKLPVKPLSVNDTHRAMTRQRREP
jgi:AcrR family transcriptional regulator